MTTLNTTNGIVKTLNEYDFINEFKAYERMDNFSIEGLRILFESLEEMAIAVSYTHLTLPTIYSV